MLVAASVAIKPGHCRGLYMSHIARHGCRCSQDLQPSAACRNLEMQYAHGKRMQSASSGLHGLKEIVVL